MDIIVAVQGAAFLFERGDRQMDVIRSGFRDILGALPADVARASAVTDENTFLHKVEDTMLSLGISARAAVILELFHMATVAGMVGRPDIEAKARAEMQYVMGQVTDGERRFIRSASNGIVAPGQAEQGNDYSR